MAVSTGADRSAPGNDSTTSRIDVVVQYWTKKHHVSDGIIIEIAGYESWTPPQESWEEKYTFQGLEPKAPCTLRVHFPGHEMEAFETRFWAPEPHETSEYIPHFRIDVSDDDIRVLNPGVRPREEIYVRPDIRRLLGGRLRRIWLKWAPALVIGAVVIISLGLYIDALLDDGEEDAQAGSLFDSSELVDVTFHATLDEGSQNALVRYQNASGGTEEHRLTTQNWEGSSTVPAGSTVWMEVANLSDRGAVHCEVRLNGDPWIQATSTGADVTAACYGVPMDVRGGADN